MYTYLLYEDDKAFIENDFEKAMKHYFTTNLCQILVFDTINGSLEALPAKVIEEAHRQHLAWLGELQNPYAFLGLTTAASPEGDTPVWQEAHTISNAVEKPTNDIEKAVDPSHYKGYVDSLQWIETMSRIPTLKDPDKFMAALELQVRKYLDRKGQKDAVSQELRKALFYLKAMIDVAENETPISVERFKEY